MGFRSRPQNGETSSVSRLGYKGVRNDSSQNTEEAHKAGNISQRDYENNTEEGILIDGNDSQHESTDGDESQSHRSDKKPEKEPHWIRGVYMCANLSVGVLIINVILVSIAGARAAKNPLNNGLSSSEIIYDGSCSVSKRWNVALHLIINILSTTILAASNYCMQTLAAPTREDIDRRHARGKWLDIGVPSAGNLSVVGPYRVALWFVLLITATPFHLMYNSAVFGSQATNQYRVVLAPGDMDPQDMGNLTTPGLKRCFGSVGGLNWDEFTSDLSRGSYEKRNRQECLDLTNVEFSSGIGTIVFLSNKLTVSQGGDRAVLDAGSGAVPSKKDGGAALNSRGITGDTFSNVSWTFTASHGDTSVVYSAYNFSQPDCDLDMSTCLDAMFMSDWLKTNQPRTIQQINEYINRNSGYDNITGFKDSLSCGLKYSSDSDPHECLVIKTPERCELLYNPPICIAVIITAAVKVTAMFLAARLDRHRPQPLLTVGDAVASFLAKPDDTTVGRCWMDNSNVRGGWKSRTRTRTRRLPGRERWVRAVSPTRGIVTLTLCGVCIIAGGYMLWEASRGISVGTASVKFWWNLGFGTENVNILVEGYKNLPIINYVVLANTPQFIVTISYYFYNSVVTSMLAAAEYSSYGVERKPLRVSWPKKGSSQRSTYWLSIPYQYGIPLLITYAALHWLISQSLFYVKVVPYDLNQHRSDENITSTLGYSPIAIFIALLVGILMVLALFVPACCRRFKSIMPVAGSCSTAISAACHTPPGEDRETVALKEVMWGETMPMPDEMEIEANTFHCGFSARQVLRPSRETFYA
ncbi:hypothetical protein MW887_007241 [Aspergillus wentii]|nr:hypothetical protein MW887_007241 [Aspergillus wentii]